MSLHATIDECNTWDKIGVKKDQLTTETMIADASIDITTAALTIVSHAVQLDGATYIATPNYASSTNIFTWLYSGTCKSDPSTLYC